MASGAGAGLPGDGSLTGGREQAGKFGGSVVVLAAGAALYYFIFVEAQGAPAPHLTYPLWPYYLCAGMFVAGGLLYGWAHQWPLLRWETRRMLRRRAINAEKRATIAETALASAQNELEAARNALMAPKPEFLRPTTVHGKAKAWILGVISSNSVGRRGGRRLSPGSSYRSLHR